MPTMNFSLMINEREALIHAIQSDKFIDVGLVIQNSIIYRANSVTMVWTTGEEVLQPKCVIDNDLGGTIKDWEDDTFAITAPSSSRPKAQAKLKLLWNR